MSQNPIIRKRVVIYNWHMYCGIKEGSTKTFRKPKVQELSQENYNLSVSSIIRTDPHFEMSSVSGYYRNAETD